MAASVSAVAADAGSRTAEVAGRAADVASGAAERAVVVAKDAAIAATPVVRSAASMAADTLSSAAGRASVVLADTAHRLADQGGDQAERGTKVGRLQARKLAKQGRRQAKAASNAGRGRLADALVASASAVRPAKRGGRLRRLLLLGGLGGAVYAVLKYDVVGKVKSLVSGGASPEDDGPEAITLPVTPPREHPSDTGDQAQDDAAAAVTGETSGASSDGLAAQSGEPQHSTEV